MQHLVGWALPGAEVVASVAAAVMVGLGAVEAGAGLQPLLPGPGLGRGPR